MTFQDDPHEMAWHLIISLNSGSRNGHSFDHRYFTKMRDLYNIMLFAQPIKYDVTVIIGGNRQQHMQAHRSLSSILAEKTALAPQIDIYNRHFYLRAAEHDLRQVQHDAEIKQLANRPKITPSSYHILCEQLEGKLTQAFRKYSKSAKAESHQTVGDNQKVDFLEMQGIVCQLIQIEESRMGLEVQNFLSQLWLILCEYQISRSEINSSIFCTTLRILMDPYNLNVAESLQMLTHFKQFKLANENMQVFLKQYPDLADETLSPEEVIKLWRKIRYANPAFKKVASTNTLPDTSTFKPIISKKTEYLAEKSLRKYLDAHETALNRTLDPSRSARRLTGNQLSRYLDNSQSSMGQQEITVSKLSHHDILYRRKLQKDEVVARIPPEEGYFSSHVSRVAKPEQIKQIVSNLYVVKQRNEDTDFVKRDEENQLKECTFSPKINHKYNSSRNSVSPVVKGYEKQVSRLHKGREQKEKKKQAYQNLGRVKNFTRNYSKSPSRIIAPSFIDRDTPKLILEINIDGDRVEKLALKGNENPYLVSKKFVVTHGLEQDMVEVLAALVKEQLNNL